MCVCVCVCVWRLLFFSLKVRRLVPLMEPSWTPTGDEVVTFDSELTETNTNRSAHQMEWKAVRKKRENKYII